LSKGERLKRRIIDELKKPYDEIPRGIRDTIESRGRNLSLQIRARSPRGKEILKRGLTKGVGFYRDMLTSDEPQKRRIRRR